MDCKSCGRPLPPSKVRKHDYTCSTCVSRRDKQRISKSNKTLAQRKKELVFDHYGNSCTYCGSISNLQIDHMQGDGKAHRQSMVTNSMYHWLIKNGFPSGFQTLCKRCNMSKQNMTDAEFRAFIRELYERGVR